ncbi:MAG: DUF1427 family protein [Armatimonadota bacterium]
MKIALGVLLAFLIGAGCRWLDLPVPAPNRLLGALLIVCVTLGYLGADYYLTRREGPPTAVSQAPENPRQRGLAP